LSVVVPSVGRASVRAAVGSVLASAERSGADVEVIVAWQGDGRPDVPGGVAVVRALAAGVSVARNAGLARARAPIVGYIDDDEVADPGWVEGVLRAFAAPQVAAAFGQVLPLDARGSPYCEIRFDAPRVIRGRRVPPWEVGTGGNMAFRRAGLVALGGFDRRLGQGTPSRSGEDTDAIARLQAAGVPIALRPDMVVRHPTKVAGEQLASRRPYGRGMGALARRQVSPLLAGHFAIGSLWALREVLRQRSGARARELVQTLWGWLEGVLAPDRWHAPLGLLAEAPPEVGDAFAHGPVRGLPVPRAGPLRLAYACGDALVLRLRTGEGERRARSLAAQRALAGHPGVPRVHAAADDGAAQWVLEDRVPGEAARADWWEPAVAWLAGLAGSGQVRTEAGEWWAEACERLPHAVAGAWAGLVRDALAVVADLPAGPALGDARPANLRFAGGLVGAADWAEAEADAVVGLDLINLAATAGGGRPRADPLLALLDGRDPPAGDVREPLAALGVEAEALPALVVVTLAHHVEAEARRRAALGAVPPGPATYNHLFERVAPRARRMVGHPAAH
jgi:Glycosyltransferase like family 2